MWDIISITLLLPGFFNVSGYQLKKHNYKQSGYVTALPGWWICKMVLGLCIIGPTDVSQRNCNVRKKKRYMSFCLGSFGTKRHSPTCKTYLWSWEKNKRGCCHLALSKWSLWRSISVYLYCMHCHIWPSRVMGFRARSMQHDTLKIMEMIFSEKSA